MSPTLADLASGPDGGPDEPGIDSDQDYTVGPAEHTSDWDDRPQTRDTGCRPEPLDTWDPTAWLGLSDPISDDADLVDKARYTGADGEPLSAREAVTVYLKHRHGQSTSAGKHGYKSTLLSRANRRYHRGKSMDRHLLDQYDNPTTVMLSLRLAPDGHGRLTLLDALGEAADDVIDKFRYQLQSAPDAPFNADDWEWIAVYAGTSQRATPHLHVFAWFDGDIRRERVVPVVEKFVEKCAFAPDDMRGNDPDAGTIRIRGNGTDGVPRRDDRPDESQGATYVLTQLPHIRPVDRMAQDDLLLASTVDAWNRPAFRKSDLTPKAEYRNMAE